MSLLALLNWHYFTIQTNEFTINQDGGLKRKDGWVNQPNGINLKCQLQSVPTNRNDEVLDFKRAEVAVKYTLFHNYTDKEINKSKRILIWINPKLSISNFDDVENIRIFNIISIKEPVALRERHLTLFELELEEIIRKRQSV